MKKLIDFLKTAWMELKKVSWPERKAVVASTIVVLIVALILMLYLGALDFVLSKAVKLLLG